MPKKILNFLIISIFTLLLSTSCYANEFGLIEFGDSIQSFEKLPNQKISPDLMFTKEGYNLYIIPQENEILNQQYTSAQYKFFNKKLYGIEYNIKDKSTKNLKIIEKHLTNLYGEPKETKDLSNQNQTAVMTKWFYKDNIIMLYHFDLNQFGYTILEIKHNPQPQNII